MPTQHGKFVISLDFELMWGVRDLVTIREYGNHLRGVHTALPKMLEMFTRYQINATFATVGFLFFETKQELLANLPAIQPGYTNTIRSPYGDYLNQVGESYATDPYHFGHHLVKAILDTPGQEMATHTFSHYYCMEAGQTPDEFREDLSKAISVAAKYGVVIKSIVFPRNQYDQAYLDICAAQGLSCVRGNEGSWVYAPRPFEQESLPRRAVRLLDAYLNLTGHHCHSDEAMRVSNPINIPASRFLRQYKPRLKLLEGLRLRRILSAMTYAAKYNKTFHLWWHPHNFGIYQEENMRFLEKILLHYQHLQQQYGFTNYTMGELANTLKSGYGA
jgi:peptidoglycan/xylan/chitin deacetylase (PgdA/CDA1 family)